ncbi:LOW QUALITY PROTEIN: U-box domain-containing protein 27-like [Phalaenopsis equestris]|uniref:LOW QUALITY PROTEIN: U-box domain-containing protein 27-like n=1 Tax=Phalaenopsis equestris TaxID=78828 RepID=UPI0009E489DB|nr:LOW QUALITY PROTEIN: U-box domain-containing protein 27-like [Phalaenopsis equestris]
MRNRHRSDTSIAQARGSPHLLPLEVSKMAPPPCFFRCPISLEVMLSPVSLCTGVTYDRSSIQRWLDSGNITCPATMQPLSSTDLIPNLTLRRLIHLWSCILSDPTADNAYKRHILSSDAFRPAALASLLHAPESPEIAVTLISLLISHDLLDADRKRELIAALLSDLDAAVSSLCAVFKVTDYLPSRIAAARVLEILIAEEKTLVAGKPQLMTELLRLIGERDGEAVDAGLRCLMGVIEAGRRVIAEMVRMGGVSALTSVLERDGVEIPMEAVERSIRVMEAAVGTVEGRASFRAEAERCVAAVVGRMTKVGYEGREGAVVVLWRVCCAGGGGRRARKAAGVAKGIRRERMAAGVAKGGLAKVLMVMQGDCSPLVRRMAGDLLRVFRGVSKGSIAAAGYDSQTMHITPY